jgi:hypothetical protein
MHYQLEFNRTKERERQEQQQQQQQLHGIMDET